MAAIESFRTQLELAQHYCHLQAQVTTEPSPSLAATESFCTQLKLAQHYCHLQAQDNGAISMNGGN